MMAPFGHDAADGFGAERLVASQSAGASRELEMQPAALADPLHLGFNAGLDERVEV